jgi:hypothetical protein
MMSQVLSRGHCLAQALLGLGLQISGAKALATEVKTSTATLSVEDVYTAGKLRDPFLRMSIAAGGVSTVGKEFSPEDLNIHTLSLRGIMKDRGVDYAIFSDPNLGLSFMLRQGKLYDHKGKIIVHISGAIDIKRKAARLTTLDKDIQEFTLGFEEAQ